MNPIEGLSTQPPRLYGTAKVHKTEILARPVLSMPGSVYHPIANFVTESLNVVPECQIITSTKKISDSLKDVKLCIVCYRVVQVNQSICRWFFNNVHLVFANCSVKGITLNPNLSSSYRFRNWLGIFNGFFRKQLRKTTHPIFKKSSLQKRHVSRVFMITMQSNSQD